jgi:hypothetical protein
MPIGMDLVDSRDGTVLAWARLRTAYVVADRVNEAYPDPGLAPDSGPLIDELQSHLSDAGSAESAAVRMLPIRERLDFVEVLAELLGWVGRVVSVFVGCPGIAGAASFSTTLTRVAPELEDDRFLLIRFERESDFVDLDPDVMTAYRARDQISGASWLEFEVKGRRVLSIRPVDEAGDDDDR